jgi:hypothetical protein
METRLDNAIKEFVGEKIPTTLNQMYSVEVYNGKSLLTVITVRAKNLEQASARAREQFFKDINVKIKRAY